MNFKKYIWLWILIALVIIYFLFRDKINSYLGFAKTSFNSPSWASCGGAFFAKFPDGIIHSFHSQNNGTDASPDMKYYKNDVKMDENGITDATVDIEVQKSEFDAACQFMYNPPYKWYTQQSGGTSGGRKFYSGGIVPPHIPEKVCIPRKFISHKATPCPYNYYDENKNLYVMQMKDDMVSDQCCYELRKGPIPNPPIPTPTPEDCNGIEGSIKSLESTLDHYHKMSKSFNCNIVSRDANPTPHSDIVDCKAIKIINGSAHVLSGVAVGGPGGYSALWTDYKTGGTNYLAITKEEYDSYVANCKFGPHSPVRPSPNSMTCDQIQKVITNIESEILMHKQKLAKMNCNKTK